MKLGNLLLIPGGLVIDPGDLSLWTEGMESLVYIHQNMPWWLGDAVMYGEAQWGDEFWQSIPLSADIRGLEKFAGVSRQFPLEDRNPSLSWNHHATSLMVTSRVLRRSLLRMAERENINSADFYSLVQERRNG